MDNNNSLIKKPKFNIIKIIKKKFLIMRLTMEKYALAPEDFKNDPDVLKALIDIDKNYINELEPYKQAFLIKENVELYERIPEENQDLILDDNPELFDILNYKIREDILRRRPEFITRCSQDDILFKVINNKKYEFITYLEEDLQIKILTEDFEIYNIVSPGPARNEPVDYAKKLDKFDPNAVVKAFEILLEQAKGIKGLSWSNEKDNIPLLTLMKIDILPPETQVQIISMDNDFISRASFTASEMYVQENPYSLKLLSKDSKIEFVCKHPEFFGVLSEKEQSEALIHDISIKDSLRDLYKLQHAEQLEYDFKITDVNDVKKFITSIWDYRPLDTYSLMPKALKNQDMIKVIARYEPDILGMWGTIDRFERLRKYERITTMFKAATDNENLHRAVEIAKTRYQDLDNSKATEYITLIAKVILNKKVTTNGTEKIIIAFINDPTLENLIEVICDVYGEQNRKIFEELKGLNPSQIQNLDIFDERVDQKFGENFTKNTLTYNSNCATILGELLRNSKLMEKYELFEKATLGLYNDTFTDIASSLYTFNQLRDLFTDMTENDLTPNKMHAIKLIACDVMLRASNGLYYNDEFSAIPLNNLNDLDNYETIRNKMYLSQIKKTSHPNIFKNIITKQFFGLKFQDDYKNYPKGSINMRGFVNYYNIEKFDENKDSAEVRMLTTYDLKFLKLLNVLNKIKNPDILKSIYLQMNEATDILTPLDCKDFKEKIPLQYSKELVKTLLTIQGAKQRAYNGETGLIYGKTEDDYEFIRLIGADFRLLTYSSRLRPGENNSGVLIPGEYDEEEALKIFNDPFTSVAGCILDPGMLLTSESFGQVQFGFSSIPSKQVIQDLTKLKREEEYTPFSNFDSNSFNYADELNRRKEEQRKKDEEEKQKKLEEKSFLSGFFKAKKEIEKEKEEIIKIQEKKKIVELVKPDFIIIYEDINQSHKKIASFYKKNGKPLPIIIIDKSKYYNMNFRKQLYKEDKRILKASRGEINSVTDYLNKEKLKREILNIIKNDNENEE